MSEALDTIEALDDGLLEYGNTIIFQRITSGAYSPTGTTTTKIDYPKKAFTPKQATKSTQRSFAGDYEVSFRLTLPFEPTKADKIKFKNQIYNIVYIAPSTLQDTDMKYEILGKK